MATLTDVRHFSDVLICIHDKDHPCFCTVFGTARDKSGCPLFLIHEEPSNPNHRGQWRYMSAKYFVPATRENVQKYFLPDEKVGEVGKLQ